MNRLPAFEAVTVLITQEDVARFARVSGDYNPIHLDPAVAKSHGFARPIVHGMLTSTLIEGRLHGLDGFKLKRFNVKFVRPLLVESILSLKGRIGEHKDATVKMRITASSEEAGIVAIAEALLEQEAT
jgi:acyl dehydratase